MNISLAPELMNIIETKISSGKYKDSNEVISQPLLKMDCDDQEEFNKLEILRREVAKGFADLDAGNGIPYSFEEIMNEIKLK